MIDAIIINRREGGGGGGGKEEEVYTPHEEVNLCVDSRLSY